MFFYLATLSIDLWPWPSNSCEILSSSMYPPNFESLCQTIRPWECSQTHTDGTDFLWINKMCCLHESDMVNHTSCCFDTIAEYLELFCDICFTSSSFLPSMLLSCMSSLWSQAFLSPALFSGLDISRWESSPETELFADAPDSIFYKHEKFSIFIFLSCKLYKSKIPCALALGN